MVEFLFFQPIEVRYGDLDPQGHVNNARFVTYLEHARVSYVQHLCLWDGKSYLGLGFILAHLEVDFRAPILITDMVQVGVRVSRLGGKSLDMIYRVEDVKTEKVYATALTTLVGFDYQNERSIPLADEWRQKIAAFEDIPERSG
jgi:acyl-CoA thioester hydrolase